MNEELLKDKFLGCLVGLAVGDALGATNEFVAYKNVVKLTDIVGGGVHKLKIGEWTDDTSMALCLAESLIEKNQFDAVDQMERYVRWYRHGYNSVKGYCFDIGNSTANALEFFEKSKISYSPYLEAGGNGAIMRMAPIPMFYFGDPLEMMKMAVENSKTTHPSVDSMSSSELMTAFIYMSFLEYKESFLHDRKSGILNLLWWPEEILKHFCKEGRLDDNKDIHKMVADIILMNYIKKTPPDDITKPYVSGSGHAPYTLEAAVWAFYNHDNFKDGALAVVNLGGDADTTGAVYGQIAGAYYGLSGIPKEWVDKIKDIDRIKKYAEQLYELNLKKRKPVMNKEEKFTFFWKDKDVFSQWHASDFTVDGVKFKNAEMYMMWKKAMLFGDAETAENVLQAKHPKECKALGRKVSGFVKETWEENCKNFVYDASFHKFSQNPSMKKILMATGDTILVEASPYDAIWGIGLDEKAARETPSEKWPGTNWLGEILTKLREDFKKAQKQPINN
jgi:ribA/ribD-fused uncharacterized protein